MGILDDIWNAPGQIWNGLTGSGSIGDQVSDWFGDVSGGTATAEADKATADLMNQAMDRSRKYGGMFDESYGKNAADFMGKSQEAAQNLAQKQAQFSSMEQAKNALKAARGAGMNRGQAALQAGQATSGAYGNTYNNALNSGMDRYGNAVNMLGNQATGNQSMGMQAAGQASANAANQSQGFWGGLGGIAGAGASLLSDERQKTDVKSSFGSLDEAMKYLKASKFKYKDSAPTPNAGKEEIGIMAQDLEKVPSMKGAVIEEDGVKKIDGAQLEGANTALIIELASRVRDLERQLGAKK